jgi:hypothetical protein
LFYVIGIVNISHTFVCLPSVMWLHSFFWCAECITFELVFVSCSGARYLLIRWSLHCLRVCFRLTLAILTFVHSSIFVPPSSDFSVYVSELDACLLVALQTVHVCARIVCFGARRWCCLLIKSWKRRERHLLHLLNSAWAPSLLRALFLPGQLMLHFHDFG